MLRRSGVGWTCHAQHFVRTVATGTLDERGPLTWSTLTEWLMCRCSHHFWLWTRLFWVGLIDAAEEGGDAFWRLDPWNARRWTKESRATRAALREALRRG